MRKSLKVSAILFAAILSVASLAGCNDSNNNASSAASAVSNASVPAGTDISLPFSVNSDGTQASVQESTGAAVTSTPAAQSSAQVVTPPVVDSTPTLESSTETFTPSTTESSVPQTSVPQTSVPDTSVPQTSVPQTSTGTSTGGSVTLREYIEQNGGQTYLDTIAQAINNDQLSTKIYFSGDDLVYDMTSKTAILANLTEEKKAQVKKTMETTMNTYLEQNKSTLTAALQTAKNEYNIKEFNIQFIVRDSDGTVLVQGTV